MNNKQAIKTIKANIHADQIVRKQNGNVLFRRSFFYTNGGSAEKFAERIINELGQIKIDARLVDKGEVWKSFKGGASIAQQSHWFAEVQLFNLER